MADYFRVHIVMECTDSSDTSICNPERIAGIDIGGECIAAITNNVGLPPVLVSGGKLREMNKNVLSAVADAKSVLRQGLDPKSKSNKNPHTSTKIKRLYALRDKRLDDYFHKLSLFIVRYCKENRIDTVVIGRNKGHKLSRDFITGTLTISPLRNCTIS